MVVQSIKLSTVIQAGCTLVVLMILVGRVDAKRPKNMSVKAAGIVLYRGVRPYEYLLMKANYPPWHWSPPKGHHDKNETDIQAAVRETEEESGYRATDYELNQSFMHEMTYVAHGRNKTVIYFLAKLKTDKDPILSKEHQDFKWVNLHEACELFNHSTMIDLYHTADVHLAINRPSDECVKSVLDFSNIRVGSSSSDDSKS